MPEEFHIVEYNDWEKIMSASYIITGAKIIADKQIIEGNILVEDGIIRNISSSINYSGSIDTINARGKYVLPGFIDIHTNGNSGFDCTNGSYNVEGNNFNFEKDHYFNGLEKALYSYIKSGCTNVVLSTIAAPVNQIKNVIEYINEYKESEKLFYEILHGLMIEGSFIKDPANSGGHNPKYFSSPTKEILNEFISGNEEIIKIINIPPEWGTDSFEAYKYLKDKNIISAVGHTNASADEVNKSIALGMSLGIHLLNGPSLSSYKPFKGGGAVEALLKSDETFIEIIVDGYHVDKSYFLDVLQRKGDDKVIAITDNMFVTGSSIVNEFSIGGKTGVVSSDEKYLYIKERPEALFGSNLKMNEAFENLVNWLTADIDGVWNKKHRAMSIEQAISLSSKLCSENPAEFLGVDEKCGTISIGKNADLLIAEIKYDKECKLEIESVFVKGNKCL